MSADGGGAEGPDVMAFDWIDDALADGVPPDAIELHVQPVVDLGSGGIAGGESFVRWRDPEHGLVPAGVWIPAAERRGVLADACRVVIADWLALAGPPGDPVVSFNVSPGQLADADFVGALSTLRAPAVAAIEIHHRDLVRGSELELATISDLRRQGCALWLDDLGDDGTVTAERLARLPASVDVVKLDRSLHGRGDLASTVASLAGTGAATLIEGIETDEAESAAASAGIEFGQGFRYGVPRPVAEWARLLDDVGVAPSAACARLAPAVDRP